MNVDSRDTLLGAIDNREPVAVVRHQEDALELVTHRELKGGSIESVVTDSEILGISHEVRHAELHVNTALVNA